MAPKENPRKKLIAAGKFCLSLLLLVWIFHSIFVEEAKLHRSDDQPAWETLSRSQQWTEGWSNGPELLLTTIGQVPLPTFAFSFLVMGGTIFIGIIRWRLALSVQGLPLPFTRACEISFVAHFFNSFLLGSTGGDLIKAWYAARETSHKKGEAVITVVADRLIGLFSMLLFAVGAAAFNTNLFEKDPKSLATLALVAAMFTACTFMVWVAFRHSPSRNSLIGKTIHRFTAAESIVKSLEACRNFSKSPKFLLKSFILSTILNLLCVFQFLILATGLNIDVSLSQLLFIVPAVICVAALPITPSGLGVRENLMVALLASTAIMADPASALSLSLLAYAGSLLWSLIGGIVYLAFKAPHHLSELSSSANDADV